MSLLLAFHLSRLKLVGVVEACLLHASFMIVAAHTLPMLLLQLQSVNAVVLSL